MVCAFIFYFVSRSCSKFKFDLNSKWFAIYKRFGNFKSFSLLYLALGLNSVSPWSRPNQPSSLFPTWPSWQPSARSAQAQSEAHPHGGEAETELSLSPTREKSYPISIFNRIRSESKQKMHRIGVCTLHELWGEKSLHKEVSLPDFWNETESLTLAPPNLTAMLEDFPSWTATIPTIFGSRHTRLTNKWRQRTLTMSPHHRRRTSEEPHRCAPVSGDCRCPRSPG
jgi:hypothetical protein